MKSIRGRFLILVGVALFALIAMIPVKYRPQTKNAPVVIMEPHIQDVAPIPDKITLQTNHRNKPKGYTLLAADMTEDEKAILAEKFKEKFKPTVEKWFNAYDGRVPFRPEEFTLDKFHSRFGDYLYTFMINGNTFTIQDSNSGLKVFYLMNSKAAKELNQLPGGGFVPDLKAPISRKDLIRMVKADSGVEFKPNEILIRPTAAASALNGGVYVHIVPTGDDPNNAANFKISMVFGQDGKLVNYERDPLF